MEAHQNPYDGLDRGADWTAEAINGMIAQEAVRRILTKNKLGKEVGATTFEELMMATGFPYWLVPYKFSARELDNLIIDMRARPTKSLLLTTMDEVDACHAQERCDLGLVFPWRGMGGLHVLTNDNALRPTLMGTSGMFWRVEGVYYLLEPLDSLIARLGPPDEW